MIELSTRQSLAFHLAMGAIFSGWAHTILGDGASAFAELQQGLMACNDQGLKMNVPFAEGLVAEIEAERQPENASARIDNALALATDTGEHWSDAFLHRIRGEILLKRNPTDIAPAEAALRAAIGVAQKQKARSFELRAAMSVARLWHDQGKRDEARNLLASVYGWFTEGFDTHDLKERRRY